jgi:hypothetical protein
VPIRNNVDALAQTNAFWANDSIEIISADANLDLLAAYSGWKHATEALDNGMKLTFMWDGSMDTLNLKCRAFLWYGITNRDPSRNGIAVNT